MVEVIAIGEGQTEETFIRDILTPHFAAMEVLLVPRLIHTSSGGKGGGLTWPRVQLFLRNTLRERSDTYVTTLFDLYGLVPGFPGLDEASTEVDPLAKAQRIQQFFKDAVIQSVGCDPRRFIPHVQPHEFESLLFSDISQLGSVYPEWAPPADALRVVREGFPTPEYINNGPTTHPSARLRVLNPTFRKRLHGSLIASHIGLDRIRSECSHFAEWMTSVESLA